MALLHYRNLGVHRPDILMRMSVRGLKVFYDFLTRTKNHMESDAAVLRLGWRQGHCPEDEGRRHSTGTWVQLVEPEDRPNEPDATFRAFLDDNVIEVHEWRTPDHSEASDRKSRYRIDFSPRHRIPILDRRLENQQLLLERPPAEGTHLLLRPNTWPIVCQRRALQALQNAPQRDHRPLLRLFESLDHASWKPVHPAHVEEADWKVLIDSGRPGSDEQRRFVNIALGTPDFAFLEGPPGSGKTTAICELVLQLAQRGKRVLLCASTHVAVDNVLERLMEGSNPHRDLMIPVRIGDRRNVSGKARRWQLDEFVRTERERISEGLRLAGPLTASQDALRELLSQGNDVIERMVLDAANLVCGTTIGILQHPDLKERGGKRRDANPDFDVLIVDEASKTPFQEFLVPALWAKRWVVVGDPKQLSPYVDEMGMAANIEACLPDRIIRDACVDAFAAAGRRPRIAAAVADSEAARGAYAGQCRARGVQIADADRRDDSELSNASIIIGGVDSLRRKTDQFPLDIATIRAPEGAVPLLRRRADAWLRLSGQDRDEQPEWASEVGWRLARLYEQRFAEHAEGPPGDNHRQTTAARLQKEIGDLLPAPGAGQDSGSVWQDIDRVRRVALPSVLESLRYGFERNGGQKSGTALSDGLPAPVLSQRCVLLSTQHRMHPDIAKFSHECIYDGEALRTPEDMDGERRWSYGRYAHRAVWIDVRSDSFRNNRNAREACRVVEELRHFDEWASTNGRKDSSPWEVAVLSFYRGQERELRDRLRSWTDMHSATRHFHRGQRESPYMVMQVCTVDRFQGHEADLVLISFANRRSTSFLESPNRLNVALTRARYQRVVIGDRGAMSRARHGALRTFAERERWEQPILEGTGY